MSSLIIHSITPKIIKINYFLHILDFNSGIDSYQITSIFDIKFNINDRVAVLQDLCTEIMEGGFSR